MSSNSFSGVRGSSQARNAISALDIDHGQATANDLQPPTTREETIAPIQNPSSLVTDALKVLDSEIQDMQVTMAIHQSVADLSCSAEWSRFGELVEGLHERVHLARKRSLVLLGQPAIPAISDGEAREAVAGEVVEAVERMPNDDQPIGVPGGLSQDGEEPDVAHEYTDNAELSTSRPKRGLRFQFGGSFDFSF
ncbi:hypothetical protein EV714DRAFT_288213 [Schizophyllum commune]